MLRLRTGVVGLPSGADQPFYRMIPDESDCTSLLGGPRGVRYVAQENLEPLQSVNEASISHELLPHLFHAFDPALGTFLPLQQLAYWYPSDQAPGLACGDDVLTTVGKPVTSAVAQEGSASVELVDRAMASAQDFLRAHYLDANRAGILDSFLQLLTHSRNGNEAAVADQAVHAIIGAHPSNEVTACTQQANSCLEADDVDGALEALDTALKLDEHHADTFARRAAVYLRAERPRRALDDATRALALEPRHIGALKCKGAALHGVRRFGDAIKAYEAALAIHPWGQGLANGVYRSETQAAGRRPQSRRMRPQRRGGTAAHKGAPEASSSGPHTAG